MPREIPSESQISKLPQWAQKYIENVERERNTAVKALLQFKDEQTETNIFYMDHFTIGKTKQALDGGGPTFINRYIQSKRIQLKLPRAKMEMEIYLNEPDQCVEIRCPQGYPYIEPRGNGNFNIVPKEDMYLHPNAYGVLSAIQDKDKLDFDEFVKKYGYSQEAIPRMIKQVLPNSRIKSFHIP
jgi:hypothetical protein